MFHDENKENIDPQQPGEIQYYDQATKRNVRLAVIKGLDSGGLGSVLLARDSQGQQYAIKCGSVSETEINYLTSIGEYYGAGHLHQEGSKQAFYVIKQRGDLNLMQYVRACIVNDKKIETEYAKNITKGCVQELLKLHSEGYVHNDVHAKNIMINQKGEVSLVDFGSAEQYRHDNKDFRYLKININPFLVGLTGAKNKAELLELLDDMVDSRCQTFSMKIVNQLQADIASGSASSPAALSLFAQEAYRGGNQAIQSLINAPNEYKRFLIAKKIVAENPDHLLSRKIEAIQHVNRNQFKLK